MRFLPRLLVILACVTVAVVGSVLWRWTRPTGPAAQPGTQAIQAEVVRVLVDAGPSPGGDTPEGLEQRARAMGDLQNKVRFDYGARAVPVLDGIARDPGRPMREREWAIRTISVIPGWEAALALERIAFDVPEAHLREIARIVAAEARAKDEPDLWEKNLRDAYARDTDARSRQVVLHALRRFPTEGCEAFLRGVLRDSPEPVLRQTAARSLSEMRADMPQTVTVLQFSARSDPDPRVRRAAAEAIVEALGESSIPFLKEIVASEEDAEVKAAIEALIQASR